MPACPKVMVIQVTLLLTCLAQPPALALMVINPSPPEAPNVAFVGLMENEQGCVWAEATAEHSRKATKQTTRIPADTPIPFGNLAETVQTRFSCRELRTPMPDQLPFSPGFVPLGVF